MTSYKSGGKDYIFVRYSSSCMHRFAFTKVSNSVAVRDPAQSDRSGSIALHLMDPTPRASLGSNLRSEKAVYDNKKAIRGGIPLVFPNFGPWDLGPQHGFARISTWTLLDEAEAEHKPEGSASVSFELTDRHVSTSSTSISSSA